MQQEQAAGRERLSARLTVARDDLLHLSARRHLRETERKAMLRADAVGLSSSSSAPRPEENDARVPKSASPVVSVAKQEAMGGSSRGERRAGHLQAAEQRGKTQRWKKRAERAARNRRAERAAVQIHHRTHAQEAVEAALEVIDVIVTLGAMELDTKLHYTAQRERHRADARVHAWQETRAAETKAAVRACVVLERDRRLMQKRMRQQQQPPVAGLRAPDRSSGYVTKLANRPSSSSGSTTTVQHKTTSKRTEFLGDKHPYITTAEYT